MFHAKTSEPASRDRAEAAAGAVRGGAFVRRVALGALAVLTLATAAPAPASAVADPVQWAVLGDSYAAGIFVGQPSPPLGSADRDGCDRTTGSYPQLVARALAADPPAGREVKLTDVSCGGATIAEIATTGQTPISPLQPPAGGWPSLAPQADRAQLSAGTEVVTISVGGNSLPFGRMLASCLLAGVGRPDQAAPCRDAYEAGGSSLDPESIHDKYDRITREYTAMLRAVQQKAPNAKIITVGYPTVVPEDPSICDRQDTTELAAPIQGIGTASATHGDIAWLHEVGTRLNEIIQGVTEASGGQYVDTATSTVGHDGCRPRGVKWVEGVCGQAGSYWPDALRFGLLTVECSSGNRVTLVHPNAGGHAKAATQVEAAIRAALT
ncbi:SGNH/GDSL hydrolase family protein [Streptomyces griseicoloratus]|uniref:SGNH/GDSL hydrolase family protein n=1 Tax=Streptomyces griseicoloratus TaxID=2752516 RepID=UPI002810CB73|nr:SGNH/GDSL hydrolase family protein [Streptomyces griseicoloratus]